MTDQTTIAATTTDPPDPTHCGRCRASLERGWSERWRENKRVEAVCFNCDDAEVMQGYLDTSVLTTKFMIRASIENVRREYGKSTLNPTQRDLLARAWASTEAIQRAAKEFERVVWFGGFAEQVRAAKHRGWRASFDIAGERHDVLAWSCAGRVVLTIEPADESRQISTICAEDGDRSTMGVQGVHATEQQAIAMLHGATVAYQSGMRFERADGVGMI